MSEKTSEDLLWAVALNMVDIKRCFFFIYITKSVYSSVQWIKFFFFLNFDIPQSAAIISWIFLFSSLDVFLLFELIIYEKWKKKWNKNHSLTAVVLVAIAAAAKQQTYAHQMNARTKRGVCRNIVSHFIVSSSLRSTLFRAENWAEERKWLSIKNQIPCHFGCVL